MTAYYNEIDPYAAQWLRNLIAAGHLAPGDVDERSIVDVQAADLAGYSQRHFFAGIGGWSLALRLAGWPDTRPVWTGSCPCQPFSAAGKGKAADDEHHLWPAWFSLIAKCSPPIVFGEQVEAAVGWGWLDAVFADLEGEGYACGATVLPACGIGAPHIRQRLWFVADAEGARGRADAGAISGRPRARLRDAEREDVGRPIERDGNALHRSAARELADAGSGGCNEQRGLVGGKEGARQRRGESNDGRGLGDASGPRLQERERDGRVQRQAMEPSEGQAAERGSDVGRMADTNGRDASAEGLQRGGQYGQRQEDRGSGEFGDSAGRGQREFGDALEPRRGGHADGAGVLNGFWSDAEWIACTDGKARPIGPGSFPLGHGIQRRASKLRAYGNAIVPQVAAEFIAAAGEAIDA